MTRINNKRSFCAYLTFHFLAALYAATCHAHQIETISLSIDNIAIEQTNGDFDELYEKWIKARLQIVNGKKHKGFFTLDNGITQNKEIESGVRRFCDTVKGGFSSYVQEWGWIFTCSDNNKQLIGKITTQVSRGDPYFFTLLDSPKVQARNKIAYEKRAQEIEAQLSENGPTGWITFRGIRQPFIRIGTFKERWPCYAQLLNDEAVSFDTIKKILINDGIAKIETSDGEQDAMQAGHLFRRIKDSYLGYRGLGLSGIKAFSLVLMSDDGAPYEQLINNLQDVESIEIDQNVKPIPITSTGQIPEAALETGRKKLAPILEERRLKALAAQREQEQRAIKETSRIAAWRKKLKVGSDTFCGPVIELRDPMIKIAVSVQLKDFASEAWLKTTQIFPPEYDCANINGQLTPHNKP